MKTQVSFESVLVLDKAFFLRLFLAFILLNSQAAYALDAGDSQAQPSPIEPRVLFEGPVPPAGDKSTFGCSTSSLSPSEAQAIQDLLKDGFVGREISGGGEKDTDRKELENSTVILTDPDDNTIAAKMDLPKKKFAPNEMSQFLNTHITGSFAFGVVLNDTLRAARCIGNDAQCAALGKNLSYRNSGEGFVENTKNLAGAVEDIFRGSDKNASFTESEKKALEAISNSGDLNSENAVVLGYSRVAGKMIPNSILSNSFRANISTNCQNSGCTISVYSMFDKYFNAWMSANMVLSTFGPELWFRAKELFEKSILRGEKLPIISNLLHKQEDLMNAFRTKYLSTRLDDAGEFVTPSFLWHDAEKRFIQRRRKYPEFDQFLQELTDGADNGSGYLLAKTNDFDTWWSKKVPDLIKTLDTPDKKSEFAKMIRDMRTMNLGFTTSIDVKKRAYQTALANLGVDSPVTKGLFLDYGRDYVGYMNFLDDKFNLDAWEWLRVNNTASYYDKAIFNKATGEFQDIVRDQRPLRVIADKFLKDGTTEFAPGDLAKFGGEYASENGGVMLYSIDPSSLEDVRNISHANIKTTAESGAARGRNLFAQTDRGIIPYNEKSQSLITKNSAGAIKVSKGTWTPHSVESPEALINRLSNSRLYGNLVGRGGNQNLEKISNTLMLQDFSGRNYWSALGKVLAEEPDLLKAYFFSVKDAFGITLKTYSYWYAKRASIPGVIDLKDFSAYMLPDTWKNVSIDHKDARLYTDSYIDFFSNEGSDDGDIFKRMINNLPWNLIAEKAATAWEPAQNAVEKITKDQYRTRVEDIAFYLNGPDECPDCGLTIKSGKDLSDFSPNFSTTVSMDGYVLEDTQSEAAKKRGQLLIAYASHLDLAGKTAENKGEPIDILKAKNDKKSCNDVVNESNWGLQWLPGMKGKNLGAAVAVPLGLSEALTYRIFTLAGTFASFWQQVKEVPKFRDCIDSDEGYFVHYFAPIVKDKKEAAIPELSTEKAADAIGVWKDKVLDSLGGDGNSLTKEAAQEMGGEIDKFVKAAKNKNIVQAALNISGGSSGQLAGKELFYFWCGEGCTAMPSLYRTEGKTVVKDSNSGISITADFNKGVLSRDGVPIVTNKDAVRLLSTDTRIPAEVLPQNLTTACLGDANEIAISVKANGEAKVESESLFSCLKDGVMKQTGLPMDTRELVDVFGKVDSVVTTTHPNVIPSKESIVAEGTPRKVANGSDAKIIISSDKSVKLSSSVDGIPSLGNLVSIQFKNGVIIVKPDGCLLVWLRHHEKGILSQNDVKGLDTKLTSIVNPKTGCSEPALNFEVQGDPGSDYSAEKTRQFNESLKHLGPFQTFETPEKRYVLYTDETCAEHLRVIDKATGKITDLKGTVSETPTGIKFTDENGKEHSLDFTSKDGVPMVSFDGGKPETLTSAEGKNGSFWYDPKQGLWYAENGQLLPLLDAFRQGISTMVGPGGNVTSSASGNILNLDLGNGKPDLLNLPSLPEGILPLSAFMLSLVIVFAYTRKKLIRCA